MAPSTTLMECIVVAGAVTLPDMTVVKAMDARPGSIVDNPGAEAAVIKEPEAPDPPLRAVPEPVATVPVPALTVSVVVAGSDGEGIAAREAMSLSTGSAPG